MEAEKEKLYHLYAAYVRTQAGIVYDEKNFFQLDSRIETLKKNLGFQTDAELMQSLQPPVRKEVHMMMIDLATNNETYFFRDPKVFEALEKAMFQRFDETLSKRPLSIWSLACSSGQEACSLLMSFDRFRAARGGKGEIRIEASDISRRILERARSGVYSHMEVQRGLPITDLMKYFEPAPDSHWKIKAEYHRNVSFSEFNLLKDIYPIAKYDIVFCRNVLIYQGFDQRKKIVEQIAQSLNPGGFLVLGNSENLLGVTDQLKPESSQGCVFYMKPANQLKNVA